MPPQASGVGVGGAGFLVVVLLIVIVIVICLAMVGSMRRLRKSVEEGTFGQSNPAQLKDDAAASTSESTTRDPADPGAEGA